MNVRNHLISAFGHAARLALSPYLFETALQARRIIFEPGQAPDSVYFMSSGVVSLITPMLEGRAVESLTVGREGAIGLVEALGAPIMTTRSLVQIAGLAWRIEAERLREVAAAHPTIADVAIRYAQVELAQLHQGAACNALHPVEARLGRWLLTCEDRVGGPEVPITQEFLAMMLGVQRTSVTLAAQALQRARLIQYQRGLVTILDRAALEQASCECYRVAEASYEAILGPADD